MNFKKFQQYFVNLNIPFIEKTLNFKKKESSKISNSFTEILKIFSNIAPLSIFFFMTQNVLLYGLESSEKNQTATEITQVLRRQKYREESIVYQVLTSQPEPLIKFDYKAYIPNIALEYMYAFHEFMQNLIKIPGFFSFALLIAMALTTLANILSGTVRSRKTKTKQVEDFEKNSAYECGFEPFEDARNSFDVNFYLVALLFILFDLEIVFLFPWCIYSFFSTLYTYITLIIFIYMLTLGFVYEWKKGALEWY